MPDRKGLALLVRMFVMHSVITYSPYGARLAATKERLKADLVLDLANLDCLESRGPNVYVLSQKGVEIASHPNPRVEISGVWRSSGARGKSTVHYWREYLVNGVYKEYESACGIPRLHIVDREPSGSCSLCLECLRRSQKHLPQGLIPLVRESRGVFDE